MNCSCGDLGDIGRDLRQNPALRGIRGDHHYRDCQQFLLPPPSEELPQAGVPVEPWRVLLELKLEPRDLWVGAFWDKRPDGFHLYLCPIPCVCFHWQFS